MTEEKLDADITLTRLPPDDFKTLVNNKGWTYRALSRRWQLTEVRISQIARDAGRPLYYDDAVRALPMRVKR